MHSSRRRPFAVLAFAAGIALVVAVFAPSVALAAATYTWAGGASASWAASASWSPARTTPASDDILVFSAGGAVTATSVPAQSIGKLQVSNATALTLQSGGAGNTLTLGGGAGALSVTSGASLAVSGASALNLALASGSSGVLAGGLAFTGATHGLACPSGATLTLTGLTVSGGTLNVNAPGALDLKGDVTVASGATLNLAPSSASTLTFDGAANQTVTNTGTLTFGANEALAVATAGTLAFTGGMTVAGTTTVNSGATLASTGTFTANGAVAVNGAFQLNQGAWATGSGAWNYGAGGTLVFNNSSGSYGVGDFVFWPAANGPVNVTVAGAGGITMNVARTVTGLMQTAAGVTNANNLTLNGTLQINPGGWVGAAPNYGSASTLRYAFNGTYGRYLEWPSSSGASMPANVTVANNTTLNYPNAGGTFSMAITGNLTIEAGSAFYMDYGTPAAGVGPLTVGGSVVMSGNVSLGNTAGGDLRIGGDFTRNTGATLQLNGRAVEFFGSTPRTLTGQTTFDFLNLTNTGGLTINNDIIVNQTLTLGANVITTGSHKVWINGPVSRTTGFVNGSIRKPVSGPGTITYELGLAGGYRPLTLRVRNVGTGGGVIGSLVTAAAPPAGSTLSGSRYVNDQWTLTNDGSSGLEDSLTFNFVAADVQGGASTSNLLAAQNSAGSWSKPAVAARTSTSLTTGASASPFGDYVLGELATFAITASAGANGSISPSGVTSVAYGASQAYVVTPGAHYHVASVLVDGVNVGAVTGYTFGNVTAAHTIAASFAIDTYTIAASAGSNGSITPSGAQTVSYGGSLAFAIAPDTHYHLADVLVDGGSVGAVAGYTFTAVAANHTIAASFAIDTYTIAASAGSNGSITPSGVQSVSHGASLAFAIAPDTHYHVADVLVDGGSVGTVAGYTFTAVAANHTIATSFAIDTYTIAASAGSNGSITPSGAQTVNYGGSLAFAIAPDTHYHVADVLVDGGSVGAVAGYTFTAVAASHTIAASFAIDEVTLSVSVVGAGGVTRSPDVASHAYGSTATLTAVPAAGWKFVGWSGDTLTTGNPLALVMTTARAVIATFADTTAPVVALTSPNGGESWNVGEEHDITWTASDNAAVASVALEYSTTGGAGPWLAIASGFANKGTYRWTVPAAAGTRTSVRVVALDAAGNAGRDTSDAVFSIVDPNVGVPQGSPALALSRPVPNPSSGATAIAFALPRAQHASLEVVDAAGRRMAGTAAMFAAGVHTWTWDGRTTAGTRTPAGVYFVRLVTAEGVRTRRLVRLD